MIKRFILILLLALCHQTSFAQEDFTEDDSYDPFADYSEFEPSEDEEADIHFFKNGRFFNLALMLGGRLFTQNMGSLYDPGLAFGVNLTYFFDIRSALQVSYIHSDHNLKYEDNAATAFDGFTGNVSLSVFSVNYKHYFNTANVTRGFADLNPYLLGGFSLNYRTITISGEDIVVKSNPMGIDIGGGIEVPISRNKMYLGLEGVYHYVSFPDENEVTLDADQDPSGITPNGDYITIMGVLGINF